MKITRQIRPDNPKLYSGRRHFYNLASVSIADGVTSLRTMKDIVVKEGILVFEIKQIALVQQKSEICNAILRALPSWFGVEASIVDYVSVTQSMPFWAAFEADKPVGFIALKVHNPFTSEVCVMGVLKEYHRCGIGRKLIAKCITFSAESGSEFLTVKTLDESAESDSYARTRLFYQSMGFRPLEVFSEYWNTENPCLLMALYLPTSCSREKEIDL